jgi:hypothetical protein
MPARAILDNETSGRRFVLLSRHSRRHCRGNCAVTLVARPQCRWGSESDASQRGSGPLWGSVSNMSWRCIRVLFSQAVALHLAVEARPADADALGGLLHVALALLQRVL